MNSIAIKAFSDELVKIGFLKNVGNAVKGALNETWSPMTWFGRGLNTYRPATKPGASPWRYGTASPAGKMWAQAKSLGGLTKVLPVGGKSMTVAGAAPMAISALQKHDPSGQERSRAERFAGATGNVMGGLIGSGLALRSTLGKAHPTMSALIGGIGGSIVGEKLLASPIHALSRRSVAQQPMQSAIGVTE